MTSSSIVLQLVYCTLLALLGIPSNAITIRVVAKRRRKTSTQIFMLVLAITDLFVCIIAPLTWFIFAAIGKVYTDNLCIVLNVSSTVSLMQSLLIGMMIALDRYLLVCRPFSKYITGRRAIVMSITCLAASILLSLPMSAAKMMTFDHGVFRCEILVKPSSGPPSTISRKLGVLSTGENDCCMSNQDVVAKVESSNSISPCERRVTNMMLVITTVFVLTWLPTIVVYIIPASNLVLIASRNKALYLFFYFLGVTIYISNAINPFVYVLMNPSFRKEVLIELRCRCNWK
ncbi:somatostatin receptor type 2-like [Diadema antillarum]|uniref:somatostatin receptor type 2-like n=1 Tax=Diadema antillarum TaxID=105358 RepID=UPI003A8493EC